MRLGFDGVNKVGELHGVLNEEHRNIVTMKRSQLGATVVIEIYENAPDDVPIPLRSIKLGSKPTDIAHSICTASRSLNSREAYEY